MSPFSCSDIEEKMLKLAYEELEFFRNVEFHFEVVVDQKCRKWWQFWKEGL